MLLRVVVRAKKNEAEDIGWNRKKVRVSYTLMMLHFLVEASRNVEQRSPTGY